MNFVPFRPPGNAPAPRSPPAPGSGPPSSYPSAPPPPSSPSASAPRVADPRISYDPSQGRYAALRMDPFATVSSAQGADDEALQAARAIQPKIYLVYIKTDVTLPHPSKPWFCYSVMPVAASLRPADPARDIEPGMCLPIAPNDNHPDGAPAPIHTAPPFPFANCYHWDSTALSVRARAAPEGWNEDDATVLPENRRGALSVDEKISGVRKPYAGWTPGPDCADPETGLATPWSNYTTKPGYSPDLGHPPPPHPSVFFAPPGLAATATSGGNSSGDTSASTPTASSASDAAPGSPSTANTSVDSLADSLDVLKSTTALGTLREEATDADLFPIVDLWYDLTAHLTQDTIPSPLEFYRERHELVKIVKEARKRAAARPSSIAPPHPLPVSPAEPDSEPAAVSLEPPPKPRRLRPRKHIRQMGQRVVTLVGRAASPVWSSF